MTETPHRAGFVALVGRPNVGKSTLLNRLVGEELAIATPKPQTTRDRIRGIRTFDDWQVVFVDTPGIHEARNLLNRYMVDLAVGTIGDADVAHLIVDVAHMAAKPEQVLEQTRGIVEALQRTSTPALLILNKVDRVRDKALLLPMIEELSALHSFEEVVPVSALKGDGVERLLELTRERLPESPPLFPEDHVTDRSMRFLAAEMVRQQLFLRLEQELPYQVAVGIEQWEERRDDLVVVYATIHVARESHKGIVIGRKGARLKEIGRRARMRMEHFLGRKVFLDLRVRVEEQWTERPGALRKLGYDDES
ncbi:MAG: GTPase Era [Myxococcota bacterium]